MKVREKISNHFDFFILISITVLFMPFFGLSFTIDPVLMPRFLMWSVVTFILLVSFTIQLCKNPNSLDYSVLRRMIFPLFLGYFLFSLTSLTKAVNITEGIHEVLKIFLSLAYLFIATVLLNKNKNYNSILVKAVIVTATILSSIGIYQYLKYNSIDYGATMANRNLLSSALFLTLPFCLYCSFKRRKRQDKLILIFVEILLFFRWYRFCFF